LTKHQVQNYFTYAFKDVLPCQLMNMTSCLFSYSLIDVKYLYIEIVY